MLVTKPLLTSVILGKFKGEDVLIPRIPEMPAEFAFEFKRVQFPVRLGFAISINKYQGQSLEVCGINFELPCFSHRQLYIACSRVGNHRRYLFSLHMEKTIKILYTIGHYIKVSTYDQILVF